MTNEKKIIITASIFLLVSFAFLSLAEWKAIDPAGKISWWTVYFENPKSTDLTFTIENNGQAKKLHWKEKLDHENVLLREADILVGSGQKSTIPLSIVDAPKGGKITIEVLDELSGKKEIYKFL